MSEYDEIEVPADERRAIEAGLLDDCIGGDEAEYQAQLAEALRTLKARDDEWTEREKGFAKHPSPVIKFSATPDYMRLDRPEPPPIDGRPTALGEKPNKGDNAPPPIEDVASKMLWLGDRPIIPPRYVIEDMLPETGLAIVGGQWFVGKTFVVNSLCAAVIAGDAEFAGKQVLRKCGVLWFPAEGQQQIEIRIKAALAERGVDIERAPFAFVSQVPCLTHKDAPVLLKAYAGAAAKKMQEQFGCDLGIIVFDTLSASAGFKDENAAGEVQKIMNILSTLAVEAKSLVISIDHYGKDIEVGVRGSSAKSGAADSILAVLGEREATGAIKNRRLALVKERGRAVGQVIPFDLAPTPDGLTCTVSWRPDEQAEATDAKTSLGVSILIRAFEDARDEAGVMDIPIAGMPKVKVVDREFVRARFNELYEPKGEGDAAHAKRSAFGRAAEKAKLARLICVKERSGRTVFWSPRSDR